MKPLPPSIDVMQGFNVQMDCIIEGSIEMVQHKSTNIREMQREFSSRGFEGRYHRMGSADMTLGGGAGSRSQRGPQMEPPNFVTKPKDTEVELGDTAEFECEVTGKPKPEILW